MVKVNTNNKDKQSKTIALVANTTWNIYNFRQNIIRKLLEEGHQVVVIAPVDEYIEYKEKYPTVKHIGLRWLDRDGVNPIRDWKLIRELKSIYKSIYPDLVIHYTHKPNIYGGIAAKWTGIPSIAVITGLGYSFINNGWLHKTIKWLYKFTIANHQKVIFENIDDRLLFESFGIIKPGIGISIKGCGVDTNYFKPIKYDSNGITTFSFIGRLLYDKGIVEFIEAAKKVRAKNKNTRFWVIGEFDEENPSSIDKRQWIKYLEESIIEYQGFVRDVRPYIAKSDCIVLPSYREAIARSLTEAMAMEKPVIATDTAGCREAIEDGENGYLVELRSVSSLVNKMEMLIKLPEGLKEQMGKSGRIKTTNEFGDQIIASQINEIIDSIIMRK